MSDDNTPRHDDPPKDRAPTVKSAYELALERLERQGIERPRSDSLSDEQRAAMAEVRAKAQAKLAELEILHRDRRAKTDPRGRTEEEDEYRRERQRIEERRDRELEKLRHGDRSSG